ncbi:11440_t:CDS:1 [Diversispora eburnea]|uniref:11440_t:CDS:1 n=1 Tax=Diversispora eburnea TaxID=1213867 RepID=A0A9N9FQF0_9GLOM|nr:11440_t:CDS:1 [Diversispora eburnea]
MRDDGMQNPTDSKIQVTFSKDDEFQSASPSHCIKSVQSHFQSRIFDACDDFLTFSNEFFSKNWKSIIILASSLVFFFGIFNSNYIPVGIYSELCQFPLSQFLLPCDKIAAYDFVSFKKEQENLLENLQKNAKEFNPPNDKPLSLRVKSIEMDPETLSQ